MTRNILLAATILATVYGTPHAHAQLVRPPSSSGPAPAILPSALPPTGMEGDGALRRDRAVEPGEQPADRGRDPEFVVWSRPAAVARIADGDPSRPRPKIRPAARTRRDPARGGDLVWGGGRSAAYGFALNEMLRQHEAELDRAFDPALPHADPVRLRRPDADQAARGQRGRDGDDDERGRPRRAREQPHLPHFAGSDPRLAAAVLAELPRRQLARPEGAGRYACGPHNDAESRWWAQCVAEGWAKGGSRHRRSISAASAACRATSRAWSGIASC